MADRTPAPGLDYPSVIAEHGAGLLAAASRPGALGMPVPTCPGWSVRDVVTHVAEVQARWRVLLRHGANWPGDEAVRAAATADAEPLDRFPRATRDLLDELRRLPGDAPVWCCWAPDHRGSAAEVARRMAHEVLVHRYDVANALGVPGPLPADLAADGVSEFLTTMLPTGPEWAGPSGVVQLRATDVGMAWVVGTGLATGSVQTRPVWLRDRRMRWVDAVLHGTAERLDLLLWGRIGEAEVTIEGQRELAAGFLRWTPG